MWWGSEGRAAADETWLSSHKPQVVAIAFTDGLADDRDCVWTGVNLLRLIATSIRFASRIYVRRAVAKLDQPGCEGGFHRMGIDSYELVFHGERPVRPGG